MDATTPGGAATQDGPPMLQMRGITKRFPGVLANDRVDFEVRAGEVHALLGENGAGKSTLMRVLYGLYQADQGEIRIAGEPVAITSPASAIALGIGMIHQHFMLVPTLTVAQNVALGLKSSRGPLTDLDRVSARIRGLSSGYGLKVDPESYVWQLSVGITVLRNGRVVGTAIPREVTRRDLAHMMVGRAVETVHAPTGATEGEVRLSAGGVSVRGDRGTEAVRGVGLEVRSGEIVGIAGVSGNGQRELAEAIAGLRRPAAGSVRLDGTDVTG